MGNFEDDKRELRRIVRELVAQLEELQRDPLALGSHTWLADLQQRLIAIAIMFVDLQANRQDPLYAFVHLAPERLAMVDQVVHRADQLARLFQQFARWHESYSLVRGQMAIASLIAALRNLDLSLDG
jgi:hypothetical protein